MQVQGPCPQDTAPGQGDLRRSVPGQQSAQQQHGGAETAGETGVRRGAQGPAAVQTQTVPPEPGPDPQTLQQTAGHLHVPDGGTVGEKETARNGRRGGQSREHGVLAALDRQRPPQRTPAGDM